MIRFTATTWSYRNSMQLKRPFCGETKTSFYLIKINCVSKQSSSGITVRVRGATKQYMFNTSISFYPETDHFSKTLHITNKLHHFFPFFLRKSLGMSSSHLKTVFVSRFTIQGACIAWESFQKWSRIIKNIITVTGVHRSSKPGRLASYSYCPWLKRK